MEIDYHDIPHSALAAMGRRFNYGRRRHGRFNWKKGNAAFAEERLKHLVHHVSMFAEYRRQADLDAILCNAAMLAWYMDRGILSENPFDDFMFEGKEQ